jgi:acyl-CoA reductase-like NAD-dependent aldehyde dehydrogenase
VLIGPLQSKAGVELFQRTIEAAKAQGGKVLVGGNVLNRPGNFVEPTLIRIPADAPIVKKESFVPISYVMEFSDLDAAVQENNNVSHGLSSSLFTSRVRIFFFCSSNNFSWHEN